MSQGAPHKPGPPAQAGQLAAALARMGVTAERKAAQELAETAGHPALVLSESVLDLAALELIPRVIAEQHRLLPIALDNETLTLAVAQLTLRDGGRPPIFDQIEFATGRRPSFLLGVESVIAEATALAYDAHRGGATHLLPSGAPGREPLAVVRPPRAFALGDPLFSADEADLAVELLEGALVPDAMPDLVMGTLSDMPLADEPLVGQSAAQHKPVVLVVDDDDDIRGLIKKVLSYDGCTVVEARTGREAMDLLRTLRPNLIVLDAMLPEIHGFDICATLKRSEAFAHTPIIIVTAVYRGWEHARTVQETHGADAFVEKPFDVHYLRQLVARMIGQELPRTPLAPDWQKKVKALRDEAATAYNMNDPAHAEDAIRRWRALDPFDAQAYLLLGSVKARGGDLDGAMKAFERAATFDGDLFAAFKNLALIYDQLGFVQRARMAWSRAHELAPDADTRLRIGARAR